MKTGVVSLGEALIDFIPTDQTNEVYQKSPGGAPANVAVGVSLLGIPSTFIGKVGKDVLGDFLEKTLVKYGVNTNQMHFSSHTKTGITFVTHGEDGERSFEFFIDPSADRFLEIEEIDEADFINHRIFHFGSISMIDNPARETTHYAIQLAKKNHMIVSYDPNLREGLWESKEKAHSTIMSVLEDVDVLKVSEEELSFMTGEEKIDLGIKGLSKYNIPLIIVTHGSKGSYVYTSEGYEHVEAMKAVAVDTTGAGDAFVSGILYSLNQYQGDLTALSLKDAVRMAKFASISGGLAVSTAGAMTALPTLEEVENYISNH